jgi:hypothetical protein
MLLVLFVSIGFTLFPGHITATENKGCVIIRLEGEEDG